jgi:archaellum component FlaC
MADDKDKLDLIKRIKEEISRLDKATSKAYQDQLKGLDAINTDLDTYEKLLSNIKDDVADLNKGFAGILKEINLIVAELEKGNKSTKDATKAFRGLESIVQKLKSDQQGYVDLNLDQLKQEKSKLKILEDQARNAAKRLARRKRH